MIRLFLLLALSGCAFNGEQPTDAKIAGLHWYVSAPDFRHQRTEWNVVSDRTMLRALCGKDWTWSGSACVIRLNEGGQCIVFSTLTETQARQTVIYGGDSVYKHEVDRHCGLDMPTPQGWSHRE